MRSCSLDTWLPEQVEFMARIGNAIGNSYWEARLPGAARPRDGATLPGAGAGGERGRLAGGMSALLVPLRHCSCWQNVTAKEKKLLLI